jgi:hypothetical protein
MRTTMVRYLKASVMTAIVLLLIALTVGLTWAAVWPIKAAFNAWGFAGAIPAFAAVILAAVLIDRRLNKRLW